MKCIVMIKVDKDGYVGLYKTKNRPALFSYLQLWSIWGNNSMLIC